MAKDYEPNSNKYKEEQKEKLEKVVQGPVKRKKKNIFRKGLDLFRTDVAPSLKTYILLDVIFPSIKKIVSEGFEMTYDSFIPESKKSTRSTADRLSYREYFDGKNKKASARYLDDEFRLSKFSYDDVIFDSRGEAEKVLYRMRELIDIYGVVSIADFYDLSDLTGSYTDNKYGWTSLRTADVVRVHGGYSIRLPKVSPLDV